MKSMAVVVVAVDTIDQDVKIIRLRLNVDDFFYFLREEM